MRIFRIKARNENNKIVNQREYLGIDKLKMYGKEVYERYNQYAAPELYEYHHHYIKKWQIITEPDVITKLLDHPHPNH